MDTAMLLKENAQIGKGCADIFSHQIVGGSWKIIPAFG